MLVGDGYERFVVSDTVAQRDDPMLEVRALVGRSREGCIQCRARGLRQESTQVGVAALGDLAEPVLAAGAELLGHQARPGGDLPPVTEVARVRRMQATVRFLDPE